MVWLMVMPNGLISHKTIRGSFKSLNYLDLLRDLAIPILKLNFRDDFIFQQDNSSVHTAKIIKKIFEKSRIKLLKWPAKSPDINIAEDLWRMISEDVYDGPQYSNLSSLEKAIDNAVMTINTTRKQDILDLYTSIPSRLVKILCKNGKFYNKC